MAAFEKKAKMFFGENEYGIPNTPHKLSFLMSAKVRLGEVWGFDFPYNRWPYKRPSSNWKRFRKLQWKNK